MANLLIVDDDPVLLALLRKLLTQQGHAVTPAEGGAAALAIARDQCFDLIMTDLMMPDMDGYALVQALRAGSACAKSLILLVTFGLHGPDPEAAMTAGADAWAAKPINAARLATLVADLLAGKPHRPMTPIHTLPEGL
jgi:CheY-like chemotaxis protein